MFDAHPYMAVIGLLVIFLLGAFPTFYGTSVWLAFLFSFLDCTGDTHEPA